MESCELLFDRFSSKTQAGQTSAAHLFVQALQLHLQGLQEALPLGQLTLGSSQSLVALLHLILHRLQLDRRKSQLFSVCVKHPLQFTLTEHFVTFLRYHCSACSLFFLTIPSYWERRSDRTVPSSGPVAESTSTLTSSLAIRDFICSSSCRR